MKKLFTLLVALLVSVHAYALTPAQDATLKAAMLAAPELTIPLAAGDDYTVAQWCNTPSTVIVWRTLVTEAEYTDDVSAEATTWSWTTYIGRSAAERDGWARMFQNGDVNPSKANVRAGFADIFSGTGAAAVAQRSHLLAMSKRPALKCESILASGAGTNASPSLLSFEGIVELIDVSRILRGN